MVSYVVYYIYSNFSLLLLCIAVQLQDVMVAVMSQETMPHTAGKKQQEA